MRIKDNFLDDKYLIQLEELINNPYFANNPFSLVSSKY